MIDSKTLSEMITVKRGRNGLRVAAKEIGNISASSLSRIEHDKLPDLNSYIQICNWLGVSADTFILPNKNKFKNGMDIISIILSDSELDNDIAKALVELVKLSYNSIEKRS